MTDPLVAVLRAVDLAAQNHVHQRRKGEAAEPYVNHVVVVARLLAEATGGGDPELVIAGLLHDSIEDTETSEADIARDFGATIAGLVAEVTDDRSLERHVRKRLQVERAAAKSARARMIKLADKTSNLRAMVKSPPKDWSVSQKQEYLDFAHQVAAGCRGVNDQLEAWFDEAYAAGENALD